MSQSQSDQYAHASGLVVFGKLDVRCLFELSYGMQSVDAGQWAPSEILCGLEIEVVYLLCYTLIFLII